LRELSAKASNLKIIDTLDFLHHYSKDQWIDWKYFFVSQSSINPRLASDFRTWYSRKIDEIISRRKKCIILDLDNTLWGGVLGEDGIDGIKIGGDYPGNTFLYFQESLIELSKKGIILAICSKNNLQDVLDAWKKNPYIILNQKYISAYRINWNDKATNIDELSQELNIGLDSCVFVDDNPTERALVKQMLPMVEVPEFPEHPYDIPSFFESLVEKYFSIYRITAEDAAKTDQYRANVKRANEQKKFSDYNEYLKSLEIKIQIQKANEFNIPRIAQMTQKTNQFNLTTHRYTESDVTSQVSEGWVIRCIDVADKFGDNGITGAIMIPVNGQSATIDTFLLSCRILGKGIEVAFLSEVLNELKNMGVKTVYASYIPTLKNGQVKEFYDQMGFCLLNKDNNEQKSYEITLDKEFEIKSIYKIDTK